MTDREALIRTISSKENRITCPHTNVAVFWDEDFERFRVDEKTFITAENAVDEFIKRTGHERISKTDDEAERSTRGS